jgi:predicted dehydrogenase
MLLVNHMRRFDPALRKLGQDIRSGKFGSIQQVRCLYVNGLMNNGTHTVDLLRWYFGEVASVQGWKNGRAAFSHRDDVNVDGILTFKSGLRAHLQSLNVDDYYLFEQEYYGTKAAVFLRDLSLTATIVPATKLGSITGLPELNRARAKTEGKKSRSYFREMARHAVACLDRRARPESTGEDARKALRILLALRKSAETRGSSVRL